jgi:hypothetical protein
MSAERRSGKQEAIQNHLDKLQDALIGVRHSIRHLEEFMVSTKQEIRAIRSILEQPPDENAPEESERA